MADGTLGYRGTLSDEHGNPIPFKTVDLGDGTFALAVDQAPGTPAVSIVTLTLANTEYSASISAGAFEFRARTAVAVRFAFATGKVAGSTDPYATLNAGECFYAEGVADCTLYLASSSAGTVVEVINYAV